MPRLKKFYSSSEFEAGCDEAGRGCLSGPVFAAAVILPRNFKHPFLNDSKQLSEAQRYELRPIIEKKAIAWSVAQIDHIEIDTINILNASFKAMHVAISKLNVKPELLLIDGNRFNRYEGIPHVCIIEGDALYQSIAAASVLAKTYRDDFMTQLHEQFPHYHWKQNKGYATRKHREAIKEFGQSPYHRQSFTLLPDQLSLEFEEKEKSLM